MRIRRPEKGRCELLLLKIQISTGETIGVSEMLNGILQSDEIKLFIAKPNPNLAQPLQTRHPGCARHSSLSRCAGI